MTAAADPTLERIVASSTAGVIDAVRAAHTDRRPLRIRGAGHWLDAGRPVRAAHALDLSAVSGIGEYVPGDLTLTALAGTSLAEIAVATERHGQWLPLDAFGDPRGTLGATLATASRGPLGGSIGSPRDVTLGVSFVTGKGELVHGGGRVVKNVAGFDLVRLTVGAWGTLGVITEATVRLRARPEADLTIGLDLPDERDALAALLSAVRTAPAEPLAAELLSPATAARIGLAPRGTLLVRLAGNATSVHHQRTALSRLAAASDAAPESWARLQRSDPADATIVRCSRRPSELSRLWLAATATPGIDAHATLATGTVRLRLTSDVPRVLAGFDADDQVIVETGDVPSRGSESSVTRDRLGHRLRDAFDPRRILNPGILGGDG